MVKIMEVTTAVTDTAFATVITTMMTLGATLVVEKTCSTLLNHAENIGKLNYQIHV